VGIVFVFRLFVLIFPLLSLNGETREVNSGAASPHWVDYLFQSEGSRTSTSSRSNLSSHPNDFLLGRSRNDLHAGSSGDSSAETSRADSTTRVVGAASSTIGARPENPGGGERRAPARATILKQENYRIAGDSCMGMRLKTPTKGHGN
jgi:hypothetical protein